MTTVDLILASASPQRAALLRQIGVRFAVVPADIDETSHPGEAAAAYVRRMASAKAATVWQRRQSQGIPVLGADTSVVQDAAIFGKPRDEQHAVAMLMRLSGTRHRVLSAVALAGARGIDIDLVETAVDFRPLTPAECRRYWATGEPRDKAGAYAIQGLGAVFVSGLVGSYSGVVGLPLAETCRLLRSYQISCWMRA